MKKKVSGKAPTICQDPLSLAGRERTWKFARKVYLDCGRVDRACASIYMLLAETQN